MGIRYVTMLKHRQAVQVTAVVQQRDIVGIKYAMQEKLRLHALVTVVELLQDIVEIKYVVVVRLQRHVLQTVAEQLQYVATMYVKGARLIHPVQLIARHQLLLALPQIIGIVMIKQAVQVQVLSGVLVLVVHKVIVQAQHRHVRLIHATRLTYGTARLKRSVKQ